MYDRPETAAKALAIGLGPNTLSKKVGSRPPIFHAASEGYLRVVEVQLATPGIDPNGSTPESDTALMSAAAEVHDDVVRALLAAPGNDPTIRTAEDETALTVAVRGRRLRFKYSWPQSLSRLIVATCTGRRHLDWR
jgi:hypothetical protein